MAPGHPAPPVLLRRRRLIPDLRHKNRDETDMIMVKIRDNYFVASLQGAPDCQAASIQSVYQFTLSFAGGSEPNICAPRAQSMYQSNK